MDPVLGIVSVALLMCIFISAVVHKISDYPHFLRTISGYELLPGALIAPVGIIVIVMELGGSVLLLDGRLRVYGAGIITLLLVLYMIAFAINIARGHTDIDCGCTWGPDTQPLSRWLLVRNAALLAFAGVAGQEVFARQLGAADWITAALASIALLTLYFCGEHLLANWSKLEVLRSQHE
jgi:uncharacterized membrane protein YphA (DoxX/SURF4 family)